VRGQSAARPGAAHSGWEEGDVTWGRERAGGGEVVLRSCLISEDSFTLCATP
jgi:hypothetical protein